MEVILERYGTVLGSPGCRGIQRATCAFAPGLALQGPGEMKILEGRVLKMMMMIDNGAACTVHDLAFTFRLSPSYLQRLFKNQTGLSVSDYFAEHRLQRAARLLKSSFMSVKEIAHVVGYQHSSSFIRAFEKRFQDAPVNYRKKIGESNVERRTS